jgi:YD repeat-containing protein
VASLSYTELGQPYEYTLGTSAEPAWLTNSYDPQTGQLTSAATLTSTAKTPVSDVSYTYDNSGNVTAEGDSATGDYQCYHYDYAGRLADAWAQGSSGCAATPSASVLGGPAPYWQHLAYDIAGNITTSNWTYNNTGTNYTTYASSYGTAQPAQPHTLTSQNVVSSAYGYWTNHDSYDVAGNLTDLQSAGYLQQLNWNDQGKLASVTDNQADSSSYTYDASGTLLLQADNTSVTLYLPDEQLVLNTSTGAVTGTRYYTIGGVTIATRTAGRCTPARVRRGFRNIHATLPSLTAAPKPGKPGPGRPPGSKNRHPATHHGVGKNTGNKKPKKPRPARQVK